MRSGSNCRANLLFPTRSGTYVGLTADPGRWFGSLIMPWLVLAASLAAFYARLLRAHLIEVMSEDYIRTARAKGLREWQVIWRRSVRVAVTPVVTALGIDIGLLLAGAVVVEKVFNIAGSRTAPAKCNRGHSARPYLELGARCALGWSQTKALARAKCTVRSSPTAAVSP